MPLRNVPADRSRGAPMNNKPKGRRQSKNKAAYAARRTRRIREQNRDRRMNAIVRGFRGKYEINPSNNNPGVLEIRRAA